MDSQTTFRVSSTSREDERHVIIRACDVCRKKKIRCEPTLEGCVQCTKYGTTCHFTPIATRRKPRRPAGFRYIAQLEERLAEVEGVLKDKSSGEPTVPDGSSHTEQTTSAVSLDTSALVTIPSPRQASDLGFGLGAAFGVHDYQKADFSTLQGAINDHLAGSLWPYPAAELQPSSLSARQQLPTKVEALELVKVTFMNYNRFLPLFDEEDFLREFEVKYSTSNPGDAGWWACLNVVLSIAHRLRALRALDPALENIQAFGYLQNALGVITELSVSERSLSAVQALVGMACILQGTSSPEPASMLVAAALRLAQAMDLHRECSNPTLTESEAEKRRRVFWKVYILDKDISLRTVRPFGQDDDDMDVRLPSKTGLDPCNVDIFNSRIGLAVIQGLIYKQLYSIQAGRQTETQRAVAAQGLSSLLSHWKSSAQPKPPENSSMLSGGQMSGETIHHVVLRLTYIHCLTMIDRHLDPTARTPSSLELGETELSLTPGSLCLAESREAIRLIEAIPHGDRSCVWMLLHAFFAAARSLLINLTQNPASPSALSDLHLIKPFLRLLETLAANSDSRYEEIRRMRHTCNSLNDQAEMAIQIFGTRSTAPFR